MKRPPHGPPAPTESALANTTAPQPSETSKPGEPAPWHQCSHFNRNNTFFYLRTHVLFGRKDFEGLFVQGTPKGASSVYPQVSADRGGAATVYYDPPTRSIAFWHGGCDWSGLTLVLDGNKDAYADALITDAIGTAKLSVAYDELTWSNDRFGSWLVCENRTVSNQLLWWDTISTKGVDESKCAKVQLLIEYL
ncbi:MAG: hypothetical protein Q9157_005520 [Trypethelium eluteriae]